MISQIKYMYSKMWTTSLPEIVHVQFNVVTRDEALQFGGGEACHPLWWNDRAEPTDKGGSLLLGPGVHVEVSDKVNVADPGGGRGGEGRGE